MPVFSFIGYTLTELFRKPDNWRQIIKKRVRLFIHQTMCREEKKINTSWQGCEIAVLLLFLKKYRGSHQRCRSSHRKCSVKKVVLKIRKLYRKTPVLESFFMKLQTFSKQIFKKETLTQALSSEVCETFKKTYFKEHLQTTASGGVL